MGLAFAAGPLSYLVPPLPMSWGLFRGINQRLLYSGGATEAELDFFRDEVAGISPWIFRARFQAVMRGDLRAALPAIKVPVLSVRGLRDQLVPAEAEKALLAIQDLRQASLDSPHVIAATRPRELAQLLKKFAGIQFKILLLVYAGRRGRRPLHGHQDPEVICRGGPRAHPSMPCGFEFLMKLTGGRLLTPIIVSPTKIIWY